MSKKNSCFLCPLQRARARVIRKHKVVRVTQSILHNSFPWPAVLPHLHHLINSPLRDHHGLDASRGAAVHGGLQDGLADLDLGQAVVDGAPRVQGQLEPGLLRNDDADVCCAPLGRGAEGSERRRRNKGPGTRSGERSGPLAAAAAGGSSPALAPAPGPTPHHHPPVLSECDWFKA